MKTVFVCLAIVLLFGVSFGWDNPTNHTNPYVCQQAKADIAKAQSDIASEQRRLYPDTRRIDNLEADIAQSRRFANHSCAPEEVCSDAKKGIAKAKEDIAKENRRLHPDAREITKQFQLIAFFKEQINVKCSALEVCSIVKSEVKAARDEIAKENRRLHPDAQAIARLQADILQSKQIIAWRCSSDDSCSFSQAEIKLARDEIAKENRRLHPDAVEIARLQSDITLSKQAIAWTCQPDNACAFGQAELKIARDEIAKENRRLHPDAREISRLQSDAANSTELIINACNVQQTCTFSEAEIKRAEDAIKTENRRLYPDTTEIVKLEAIIRRMKEVRFYKCGNSGFMRLAERFARRGGRVLAKWLRQ